MFKSVIKQGDMELRVPDNNGGIGIGYKVIKILLCFPQCVLYLLLPGDIICHSSGSNNSPAFITNWSVEHMVDPEILSTLTEGYGLVYILAIQHPVPFVN